MKKFMAIALLFATMLCNRGGIYAMTAEVTNLDYNNDVVTIETATGLVFEFYGTEDYDEGDLVSCVMYTNFTAEVTDDIILNVRYSGYTK